MGDTVIPDMGQSSEPSLSGTTGSYRMIEDEPAIPPKWWHYLSARLQQARDEERSLIGREFHDELGQVLAAVQMGVTSLAEEYSDHAHLIAKIEGLEHLLAGAIQTVQRISSQLWPGILNVLGLAEAVEWNVKEFQNRSGISCRCIVNLDEKKLSKETSIAVYRIFQECLTNIYRHARASNVLIILLDRGDRLILVARDDGCGITPEQVRGFRSMGIMGMRERAGILGGRVRWFRGRPRGTVVVTRVPLSPPGREK